MCKNNDMELIEVFSGKIMEAEIVKSLLENAEIDSFLKDEFMDSIAPWYSSQGGSGSVKVIIRSNDKDKAILIIEDYTKNINIEH